MQKVECCSWVQELCQNNCKIKCCHCGKTLCKCQFEKVTQHTLAHLLQFATLLHFLHFHQRKLCTVAQCHWCGIECEFEIKIWKQWNAVKVKAKVHFHWQIKITTIVISLKGNFNVKIFKNGFLNASASPMRIWQVCIQTHKNNVLLRACVFGQFSLLVLATEHFLLPSLDWLFVNLNLEFVFSWSWQKLLHELNACNGNSLPFVALFAI